jgi:hypothetical protein
VGPVKGFYRQGGRRHVSWQIKWRVVKILEKTPAKVKEYSSGVERDVRNRMMQVEREAIMAGLQQDLLDKFPYKIYSERLKDFDPLDIP